MNVVITGKGIISAIGCDTEQVLEALQSNTSGIGKMQYLPSERKELPVGEVKLSNREMQRKLGIDEQKEVSRTALMGTIAIKQAVEKAHISLDDQRSCRILLIVGTTVGGMDRTELHFHNIQHEENLDFLKQHDCGSTTRLMADYFGFFSDMTTISTACSSAANALLLGARLIKAGEADIVVAGGTEALSKFHLNGFNSLMILDKEQCRPFDASRAGLNLGEGAAFVVMESEQMAQKRGAHIEAYLTGYGNACDAYHQTASSPDGEGAYLSMQQALSMANLHPSDIQYVNAHGTGTPNNDQSETAALQRVFGNAMPPVSSTKAFTGHTTSAAGSIETVICLLAMEHHFLPANLGWATPMPEGITPTMGKSDVVLNHVLCNSFGFGGNDTSLILSTCPTTTAANRPTFTDRDIRIVAQMEISSEAELADLRNYVKPMEMRRMGKLMKGSLLTSLRVLEQAGIEKPDAIITGTHYGCIENSEQLLQQIDEEGEKNLKPTLFMQSTHNTIGGNIAIKTQCHGYNVTYTQENQSLEWALRDARMLLKQGICTTVLVGCHDETTPLFRTLLDKMGYPPMPSIHSISMLLKCGK